MTFESYDYRYNAESLAPSIIRDLATYRFIKEKRSLVFCGPPGIGKTHISQALDDFGFRRYEPNEAEILYSLADARLGVASTIITSNRPPEDWYGVFPDPVIGGAVLDRMVAGAIMIIVEKAESCRKR